MIFDAATAQDSVTFIQGALNVLAALQVTSYKYPEQSCIFDGRSFDYIVVGGGTAGCVAASRLVEDNKTSVLIIEAGDDPPVESDMPALMLFTRYGGATWNFTIQDPGLYKVSHVETNDDMKLGRILGGTSAMNFVLYTTGSKHDYNNWAKLVNDSIWNWENVLPYLKKSQRLENPQLLKTDSDFFGQSGHIGLNAGSATGYSRNQYIKIFNEAGHEIIPSMNGNRSLGYTDAIYTFSGGKRQNTAFSYLMPQRNNPKLYVLKNSFVKKIIFDSKKNAIGVTVLVCNQTHIFLKAKKEVIISAGIVNTPKLLMLSGIGAKQQLCKHKIHTISDLPVGEGLQNLVGIYLQHNMTNKVAPYRPFNPYGFPATSIVGYVAFNKSNDYPDYDTYNFVSNTKTCMIFCSFGYGLKDEICDNTLKSSVNSHQIFSIINLQKFKSRGKVLLRSGNFRDDPLIYTGYFSNEEDRENLAKAIIDYLKIQNSETYKKLGGLLQDPKLPKCGEMNINDIEYWKCYILYMTTSQHHYSGTCPMGTIVDSRLRVFGVKRLRVVDASVIPNPPVGGPLGATIMIGEKAADMIKGDNKK